MATTASAQPLLLPASPDGRRLLAKFFKALADPTRLILLEYLLGGERTVSECVVRAGLSQGRVSAHLACLADCGFVAARRAGRHTYYQVVDPRVSDLVVLGRSLAAENATALDSCPRIQE